MSNVIRAVILSFAYIRYSWNTLCSGFSLEIHFQSKPGGAFRNSTYPEILLGVSHLMHFADYCADSRFRNGDGRRKRPDFIGLRNNNSSSPILIEAKGTLEKRVRSSAISNAVKQLNSISEVLLMGVPDPKPISQFEKHIVCSACRGDELIYYDIDPESRGNESLRFMANQAMLGYYETVLDVFGDIVLSNAAAETKSIAGVDYVFANDGDLGIGLIKDLYGVLANAQVNREENGTGEDCLFTRVLETLGAYTDELNSMRSSYDGKISVGSDGIAVEMGPSLLEG